MLILFLFVCKNSLSTEIYLCLSVCRPFSLSLFQPTSFPITSVHLPCVIQLLFFFFWGGGGVVVHLLAVSFIATMQLHCSGHQSSETVERYDIYLLSLVSQL